MRGYHEFSPMYCIAGFLCEDFNLVIGSTHNIKIHKVFNTLHFVTRMYFAITKLSIFKLLQVHINRANRLCKCVNISILIQLIDKMGVPIYTSKHR